jgi:hypothetical protein
MTRHLSVASRLNGRAYRLIALLAASVGCYSSHTTNLDDYEIFVRFKADGNLMEFTSRTDLYGVFVGSVCSARESLEIAAWEPWDTGTRLGLYLTGPKGFGTGTYSSAQGQDPRLRLLYYRAPEGGDYFADPAAAESAMITISHVDIGTISGTFFGVLKAEGHPDVVITDGEFLVRREHDLELPC